MNPMVARRKNGQFVKSTKRTSRAPRATPGRKRRTNPKNKTIAPLVAGLTLGVAVLASPAGSKAIQSVRSRSVQPITSWNKQEAVRTGMFLVGGHVGGKVAGNVLNKITPVKHAVNAGRKLLKGLV